MVTLNPENIHESMAVLQRGLDGAVGIDVAYEEALEIEPRNPHLHLRTGLHHLRLGDMARARQCFENGLAEAPAYPMAYMLCSSATSAADPTLARTLAHLGLRMIAASREVTPEVQALLAEKYKDVLQLSGLAVEDPLSAALLQEAMEEDNPLAPVPEWLAPYELVQDVLGEAAGDRPEEVLAALRADAARCVPVLLASIRYALSFEMTIWPEAACRVTAMLGEIGGPEVLPALTEIAHGDDINLGMHAQWALWRMGQRFPGETVLALAAYLGEEASWPDVVDQLVLLPERTDISVPARRLLALVEGDAESPDAQYALTMLERALRRHKCDEGLLAELERVAAGLDEEGRVWLEHQRQDQTLEPSLVQDGMTAEDAVGVLQDLLFDSEWQEYDENLEEDMFEDDENTGEPLPYINTVATRVPAVAAPKIGRNDVCWCGSGKKYKKCHLEEDENQARQSYVTPPPKTATPPHLRLRDRMMEEIAASGGKKLVERAFEHYYGDGANMEAGPEADISVFIDWLLFDYRLVNGRTPCEEYLQRHRLSLTAKELAQIEAWRKAQFGIWEVLEVQTGSGLRLKNLATEEERLVVDTKSSSGPVVRWDVLLQRVESSDGVYQFVGNGSLVPRNLLPRLWEWIDAARKERGESRAEAIAANSHALHRVVDRIHRESWENLRLENFDGDPLEMGDASYVMEPGGAVLELLRGQKDVSESKEADGEVVFRRFQPNKRDGSVTTIATMTVVEGKLMLHCNSRKRMRANRKWLEKLAGQRLVHLSDVFRSTEEAKREALFKAKAGESGPEVPEEAQREMIQQFQEQHYAKWVDRPVPALQGKTPREAAQSKAGRSALEALLRDLENGEERRRRQTGVGFDFGPIRRELKLT